MSDDLEIPSFLRREVTPATKAAVTRQLNERDDGATRRLVSNGVRSSLSAGHSLNLDDAGKAMIAEASAEAKKAKARAKRARAANLAKGRKIMLAQKKAAKADATGLGTISSTLGSLLGGKKTPGPKETALREARTGSKPKTSLATLAGEIEKKTGAPTAIGSAKKGSTKKPTVTETTDIPDDEIFGGNLGMPKADPPAKGSKPKAAKPTPVKTKKDLKKVAPKAKAESSAADLDAYGFVKDTKQSKLFGLLVEAKYTHEQLCKKLDWKTCRVTSKRLCDRVGAKLTRNDDGVMAAVLTKKGKAA